MLVIFPNNTPFHVIGTPALIGYYSIHDMEEGRVGFAPHVNSLKKKLRKGDLPTQVFKGVNPQRDPNDPDP